MNDWYSSISNIISIRKYNFSPIEDTTPSSQTVEEDLPPIGLVSKTPYRDLATYKEEWYTHPIDK